MILRYEPQSIAAATLFSKLNKKALLKSLKTTALFTFLNIGILLANRVLGLELPFQIITRFWILAGILSFVFLQFIMGYLYEKEVAASISAPESKSFLLMLHFEALKSFSGINPESPNLVKLLERILKSSRANFVLAQLEVDTAKVKMLFDGLGSERSNLGAIADLALESAQKSGSKAISSADLLWGFLKTSPHLEELLVSLEMDEDDVTGIIFWSNKLFDKIFHPKSLTEKLRVRKPGFGQSWSSGYTNVLDRFSHDLASRDHDSYSTEGRQGIVAEIETVLTKGSRSNVILVGETGVGKSTIVSGLASRIFWGESLPDLNYKRVVEVNVGAIISASKDQSELQSLMMSLLNDAVAAGNIILFIDNIHTIFSGGGKEGTIDVSEMVAPYLERSGVKIIGSTSQSMYETYLSAKQSVSGYFDKINVPPTEEDQTIRVMAEVGLYYEQHYNVTLRYSALKESYRLCSKLSAEKEMPGRAVDFLENICAAARNNGLKNINKEVVDLLAEKTLNVPLADTKKEEKEKLLNLEELIHGRVVGQEEAVKAVSDALRRARARVSEKERPIGSFLFLGPTGVGKTELAKAISESYFGNEDAMIRVDMNEYQAADSAGRFTGTKLPGREELEGGELVKKVREKPFSLILLDELEKASPEVLNLFLQLLDEGYLTDGMGQKVIFTNTIIVATSNGEANYIRENVEAGMGYLELKEQVINRLLSGGTFKPEFVNRFDGVILFKPLSREQLADVAALMFEKTVADLKKRGYIIRLEDGLLARLAEEGYQPEMGARPMRRVFQDRLESYLAKKVLEGTLVKGQEFLVQTSEIYS